jgi:hypothetical protein
MYCPKCFGQIEIRKTDEGDKYWYCIRCGRLYPIHLIERIPRGSAAGIVNFQEFLYTEKINFMPMRQRDYLTKNYYYSVLTKGCLPCNLPGLFYQMQPKNPYYFLERSEMLSS